MHAGLWWVRKMGHTDTAGQSVELNRPALRKRTCVIWECFALENEKKKRENKLLCQR